ncbi:PST family polysaccharide transporter [Arthrobacter stackebrandtii]|uniref:PST family polysaccharide transporter n=1 Tax=Arthrobacter stackebrandtii TaxID=272161 RepID=A0ABS4YRX5_9MICC|nr:oligosaccharide flippase family protein [Arthrobacter stackebrandtii]MBP2411556.1 PST family polysaccharide transporter [Arthrobacter stackebrandtii]PYG99236.1 hypothetical protein CVV67_16045 [Arthrobacter stackebrandtii]
MTTHTPGLPVMAASTTGGSAEGSGALVTDVRRGALWTGASTMLLRISNIALMAVVARIVAPDELGVFALAVTVQAVLVSMAELGVASVIARTEIDIDKIAPTVVTISVTTSLVLGSLMALGAEPLAVFLGSPDAAGPIRIMALCVAMIGPFAVPGAQLQRDFRQDLLFRANILAFLPSAAVLVLLALGGDGASAFAWSRVAGQLVAGVIMVLSIKRNYLPGFEPAFLRPLLRFGLPLAAANILSQVLLNVDYVFVGRMMGEADVGLYMLAFNVCMWSGAVIGAMLNGIVLPAFSTVLRDGGDTSAAIAAGLRTVALVACPLAAFTCAFATPLITTIYGGQWAAAGPVLAVLSFYGVVSVIGVLFANIIIATGRTGVLFLVQAIALAFLVPALAAGIHLGGLVGIGVAHLAVISLVTLPVYLTALHRSTGVRLGQLARAMVRPVLAATAAALLALLLTAPIGTDILKVAVGGCIGAAVYFLGTRSHIMALLPRRAGREPALQAGGTP